jgi:XTP/dITP diphosphohydrolase
MPYTKTTICLATNNKHKVEELKQLLGNEFIIKTLDEIGCHDEIAETGETFEANSKIKADYIFNKFNLNVIADDSGLEVESLNNQPGVYSARYAGEPVNHQKNIEKLLSELTNNAHRNAKFRTVITLIFNGETHFFEGQVKGEITYEQRGTGGFGYDSVFIPKGYNTTFAEMSSDLKNTMSHRANAVILMKEFIHKKNSK